MKRTENETKIVVREERENRKLTAICWDCPNSVALHNNCKFVTDHSKCPKISGWMKQNNIKEL